MSVFMMVTTMPLGCRAFSRQMRWPLAVNTFFDDLFRVARSHFPLYDDESYTG